MLAWYERWHTVLDTSDPSAATEAAGASRSALGSGGMRSKLRAARLATGSERADIDVADLKDFIGKRLRDERPSPGSRLDIAFGQQLLESDHNDVA